MPEVNAERIRSLLGSPALAWLVERLRKRMARGEALTGTIRLSEASPEQRTAIDKLIGRTPSQGKSLTIDLDRLAELLVHGRACTRLEDAIVALVGPVRNVRAEAYSHEQQWAQIWDRAATAAQGHAPILGWIDDLRTSGLLKRLASGDVERATTLINQALSIVSQSPYSSVRLAELAASETGDSHALDPGQPLGSLVLRFAIQLDESASWRTAQQRRDAWETLGVLCDELSAPVLVFNLSGDCESMTGQALNLHASAGEPYRISVRQLRLHPPAFDVRTTGADVYICENPTVVDVAANRLGARCKPLICIDGQPKTASRLLLNKLSQSGCTLHYHGDFDWDGIRIGNTIVQRHGAVSWRFSTSDYSRVIYSDHALKGKPVVADWDAELAPLMIDTGVCVHEEQVLDDLLSDLS